MKTGYSHEAEAPFLACWPKCEPEVDWHRYRVLVELDEGDEIRPEDMAWLVDKYGAERLNVSIVAPPGSYARLLIVAELERP